MQELQKLPQLDRSFFIPIGRLEIYEEFSTFANENRIEIINFIQLAYNKNSPLVEQYESLPERLKAALTESGLPEDRAWSLHLVSVGVDLIGDRIVPQEMSIVLNMIDDMITCYLSKIQYSNYFEMYITYQMFFWELTHRMRNKKSMGADEKDLKNLDTKVDISDPCYQLIGKIDALRVKIFGENERIATKVDLKLRNPNANNWAKKEVRSQSSQP